jgi:RND family efflux transporter MFP subunit
MQRTGKTLVLMLAAVIFAVTALAQSPIPVQVVALSRVLIDLDRRAPADVRSLNSATIAAEISAVVEKVHSEPGQAVNAGDLLLELDRSDYELALQQAQAGLESSQAQKALADAKLLRARELGSNQYLSADELLMRETEVIVLVAQIKAQQVGVNVARNDLDKCSVEAPFNGVVHERFAQLGDFVSKGSPLVGLTQTDQYELNAEIPDEHAASLQNSRSISFVSRNESWPVQLLRLSPLVSKERRSRQARFAFPQAAPAIGRSGELLWQVENGVLPANLIVRRNGRLGIFLNRSGIAHFIHLPGAQEGRPVTVDLPLDSEIIVEGRERLQDGMPISVDK